MGERILEDAPVMMTVPRWRSRHGGAPRYVVIRDGVVVQRFEAESASDALAKQTEAGDLAVLVGG